MVPSMIFSSTGMALFGYFASTGQSAVLCAAMQAIEVFGVLIGNISTMSYALDAFRAHSNEVFIMAMLVKVCALLLLSIIAEIKGEIDHKCKCRTSCSSDCRTLQTIGLLETVLAR